MLNKSTTNIEQKNRDQTETITAALNVLFNPGDVVEVRLLNTSKGTVSGYFNDWQKLAHAVKSWDGTDTIYVTLNTVNPELLSRAVNRLKERTKTSTTDTDIVRRRWLFVDFDPRRPAGISSTDAEHAAAKKRAGVVRDYLKDMGFYDPIVADSGNGWHLLYRIDEPNDDETLKLIDRCLKALSFHFGDISVDVDETPFNASRICKLYGTIAVKGDHTPERPHRRSSIISLPKDVQVTDRSLLERLAAFAPAPPVPSSNRTTFDGPSDFDLEQWIAAHALDIKRSGPWQSGGYRWILNTCPWDVSHTDNSAYILKMPSGAISAGCHHNSCTGRTWQDLRELYDPAHLRAKPLSMSTSSSVTPKQPGRKGDGNSQTALTAPVLSSEGWDVLMLSTDELPNFPIMALPPALRAMAKEVARCVQVPIDMSAMTAVGVFAAATRGRCRIQIGSTHSVHSNLYTLIVAPPSSRKSEVLDQLARPLFESQHELRVEAEPKIKLAQAKAQIQEERLKAIKTLLSKPASEKTKHDRIGLEYELEELVGEMIDPPTMPHLIADDITQEALGQLMHDQADYSMAILSAEGGFFENIAGRYSKGDVANMDLVLKAFNAEPVSIHRIGRPPLYIPRATLTLMVMVQPSVTDMLAEKEQFRGKGFLSRLLYVYPRSMVGERDYENEEINPSIREAYNQLIFRMFNMPNPVTKEKPRASHVLRIEGEALDIWATFHNAIEKRMGPDGDLAFYDDWAGKLASQAARLAGLFHLANCATLQEAVDTPISGDVMLAAWSITEYLLPHAMKTFHAMASSTGQKNAMRVVTWIQRKGLTAFTFRDCYRQYSRSHTNEEVKSALDFLVSKNALRMETPVAKTENGRPPLPYYAVHPELHKTVLKVVEVA